ncbi:MAG: hypothetical protein HYU39_02420 [Thaumarchaeota archaeon]|nr:hypothetical protein [Nitrososphaerota archaeon]
MVKIVIGKLKDKAQELAEFVGKRFPDSAKPTVSGAEIVFENDEWVKTRDLKTYLKRFLHNQKMRDRFRVKVTKDTLELVEITEQAEE